jgi:hypothetical protein
MMRRADSSGVQIEREGKKKEEEEEEEKNCFEPHHAEVGILIDGAGNEALGFV